MFLLFLGGGETYFRLEMLDVKRRRMTGSVHLEHPSLAARRLRDTMAEPLQCAGDDFVIFQIEERTGMSYLVALAR